MKIYAAIFIIFISSLLYGQNENLPKIKFYQQSNAINPYVKMLGLTDKNAIIVAPYIISQEQSRSFLVILSDGRMYKFATKQIDDSIEVRSEEVAADQKSYFLELIRKMNSLRIFKTNDIEAYNYWKELQKKEKGMIVVVDGPYYSFEIFKRRDIASYGDYAPKSYIKSKRPGYELKKEFISIFEAFDFMDELWPI
jgi:hypothetical protein